MRVLKLNDSLTNRLSDWYGIYGQAHNWFSSYLQNRHQSVKIKEALPDKVTLSYGAPQGSVLSVLGPVLSTLYTTLHPSALLSLVLA